MGGIMEKERRCVQQPMLRFISHLSFYAGARGNMQKKLWLLVVLVGGVNIVAGGRRGKTSEEPPHAGDESGLGCTSSLVDAVSSTTPLPRTVGVAAAGTGLRRPGGLK
jgi:hypothetical protein